MLEEKLEPVLRALRGAEDFKGRYDISRNWFQEHEENLAEGLGDLSFLCKLPSEERRALTYPVIGNWVLEQMQAFEPQTEHQGKVYAMMMKLVSESRFNNHHMQNVYEDPVAFTRMEDELLATMLSNPEESMPIHRFMCQIAAGVSEEIGKVLYRRNWHEEGYAIDLGHGICSPVNSLSCYIGSPFERLVKENRAGPIGLTIMVVDDEHPEEWYHRLLAVGFEKRGGQEGVFYDCETALEALRKGHYDVILTDLELGEGKMGGIEFVERAYKIQKRRGITPMISVFSYNADRLMEAEKRLHWTGKQRIFQQVAYCNNKRTFTATGFKENVVNYIRRPS